MFINWRPKLVILGGLAGWVFTLLAFFGIDARTILDQMSTHYLWLFASFGCFAIFGLGLFYWWQSSRVTPDNVQTKIREWLDTFSIAHRVIPWDAWHFRFDVTLFNWIIFVGRPKDMAGRYLAVQIRGQGIPNEYRTAFDKLTVEEKAALGSRLIVETTKARMVVTASNDLSDIIISRYMPISATLSESEFIDGLNEVYQASIVLWNSIALRLSENPKLMQSLLTPDTEASPPAPTS